MNWLASWSTLWVVAQGDYVHMGRRFRQGGENVDPTTFTLFVCGLLAILAIALIAARIAAARQAPGYYSEKRLFRELCRAHNLDWPSRRLLRQLAAVHQLDQPAQLFLHPEYFSSQRVEGPLKDYRDRIGQLAKVMFAEEEGEVES